MIYRTSAGTDTELPVQETAGRLPAKRERVLDFSNDWQTAVAFSSLLAGHPRRWQNILRVTRTLTERSAGIVNFMWPQICALADRAVEKEVLGRSEILAILDGSRARSAAVI